MRLGRLVIERHETRCPDPPHLIRARFWVGVCLGRTQIRWRRS